MASFTLQKAQIQPACDVDVLLMKGQWINVYTERIDLFDNLIIFMLSQLVYLSLA